MRHYKVVVGLVEDEVDESREDQGGEEELDQDADVDLSRKFVFSTSVDEHVSLSSR